MITIDVGLSCDRCKTIFGNAVTRFFEHLFSRDVVSLRERAYNRGWRRFRLKNTGPNGDFCPKCVKAITEAKPAGGGKRNARASS